VWLKYKLLLGEKLNPSFVSFFLCEKQTQSPDMVGFVQIFPLPPLNRSLATMTLAKVSELLCECSGIGDLLHNKTLGEARETCH